MIILIARQLHRSSIYWCDSVQQMDKTLIISCYANWCNCLVTQSTYKSNQFYFYAMKNQIIGLHLFVIIFLWIIGRYYNQGVITNLRRIETIIYYRGSIWREEYEWINCEKEYQKISSHSHP